MSKGKGDFNKKEARKEKSADKKGAPSKQEVSAAAGFKPDREKYESRMKKTVEVLESEFSTIRAGRANPAVLNKVTVDYYGCPTPIQQMANISVPEARIMVIQPWDRSMLKAVEKAIQASDVGINPTNDGTVLRLVFPELTEERRKDLSKDIRKKGEASKVAVRNIRREAMDSFKKAEKAAEMTEDDRKRAEEDLQKLTDKFIAKIDKTIETKTKEIMTV